MTVVSSQCQRVAKERNDEAKKWQGWEKRRGENRMGEEREEVSLKKLNNEFTPYLYK